MSQSTLHYEQGKLCYQNKKFHDAIFQFSEAIRLKPDNNIAMARCYNARGVVYFYLGEFKKVIKDCTKALELDSENANYYNCRGNAYFSLGKFGKAAEDFSKAITLSPEASHGRYYNNRGSAYRRLKMFKEAIDDYTAAIQVDPKNGNYYNNRGNTYFDMGEFQLAIDDFTTALGLEPYSPKTKLTLAQAHEALAQEKRMKNATQFQGFYSHMKTVKQGKRVKSYRKDRQASIYVSPAGVEVTFERGWRAKKDQQSFAWSEDMKIELVDDETVKLYMDKSRQTYVIIKSTNPDGPAVEEELIGRITTKFASYSTACLVAQHEGVCNEYADIIKSVKKAEEQLALLKVLAEEAEKQKAAFIKNEQFDKAEKSKAQAAKLQDAIKQKQIFIETESTRAESVRVKAEQEAGPVLDMVLIMQNRVRELYQTRVKGVKQHYKVDDLELEEQLAKMEQLVVRAQELQALVSRSVQDVRRALDVVDKDEEIEDDDEKSAEPAAAAEPEPEPTPTPASAPAPVVVEASPEPAAAAAAPEPEPAPAAAAAAAADADAEPEPAAASPTASAAAEPDWNKLAEADSDGSDWDDDIDGVELPTQFAPTGQEVFMTVESANGMVTITPSKSTELRDGPLPHQGKMGREILLMDKTSFSKLTTEAEQKAHILADELEKYKQENATKQQQLEEKEHLLNQMVTAQHAAHELAAERERLAKELEEAKKAAEDLANAKSQMEAAATTTEQQKLAMEQQHQEAMRKAKELNDQVAEYHNLVEQKNAEEARLKAEYEHMAKQTAEYEAKVHDMASRLEEEAEKRRVAEEEIKRRETEHAQKAQELQQAVAEKEKEKKDLWEQVREQDMSLSAMRKHLQEMQAQLKAQADAQAEKDRMLAESKALLDAESKRVAALKEQSIKEEQKRRELHNLIQEIKGNIRVYVRIRPGQHADAYNAYESVIGSDDRGLRVVGAPEQSATGGAAVQKKWEFEFDRVFFPNNTQNEIFSEISQLVQSALDGYAVSIFAYGQTGSGKTYTMEGPSALTDDTKGMIPRSVAKIFEHSEAYIKKGWSYTTEASFLEIYNTEIRDLLRTGDAVPLEVKLVATKTGNKTEVPDLTWLKVTSAEDLEPIQKQASAARASAATLMNERSSRSHSVFTLRITGYHKESGQASFGVLNLIDLAGSERVEKSGAVGQRLDEAKAINASLSCLGDVIAALAQGSKHVPFRNSKLTYLLQDSFGGGSKTLMFINIAPELEHMQESLSSLRFGAKVHDCHIGTGKKNVAAAPAAGAAAAPAAAKKPATPATKAKK